MHIVIMTAQEKKKMKRKGREGEVIEEEFGERGNRLKLKLRWQLNQRCLCQILGVPY
jgi:hypothetical protein